MRQLLRTKPWILIVVLLGAMVLANVALLVTAIEHPPVASAAP
jgi:hypothetical protein